ncbi:MAG: 30S ribosomal protein S12 methylthiotransferase RimO [Mogibacterium sp.]|nr:30S ribosomal protein S12 methylthiotransferase RimO [Mogibacterium sp.]
MPKTFYIDTLGCAKNDYDSEVLASGLVSLGCVPVSGPEDADILIVNTCGFIESAKVESIEHIFSMAEYKGQHKKLVVTGCLSQRYHEELVKEIPEVDLFAGVNDYEALPALLVADEAAVDCVTGEPEDVLPYRNRLMPEGVHTSILKIAEGCDNYCTFCIIPKIRGKYRSKRMEDVLREAEFMASQGVRELVLIAQDTSCYGIDLYGEYKLPELLHRLNEVDGIEWIRLMYVYDNAITDELIDAIAECDKVCNYIDMPIQHISDHVLRLMGRRSTKASILKTINKLRDRIPDVRIRTTLLVGSPGETGADFDELIDFVQKCKLDRVGVFAYSEEEDTPAAKMGPKVPAGIAEARRDTVMAVQQEVSLERNAGMIGHVYEVIVDEVTEDGICLGRTRYDAPEIDNEVSFTSIVDHEPGDIAMVRIDEAYEYDIVGEEVF